VGNSEAYEAWKKDVYGAAAYENMAAESRERAKAKAVEARTRRRELDRARLAEGHREELRLIEELAEASRLADQRAQAASEARDAMIVGAVRAGLPMRMVAEHAGVSHTIVHRILARSRASGE
jgi:hypothetical protein